MTHVGKAKNHSNIIMTFEGFFNDVLTLTPSLASYLGDRSKDGRYENSLGPEYNKDYASLLEKYSTAPQAGIQGQMMAWKIKNDMARSKLPFDLLPMTSFENLILNFSFLEKEIYASKPSQDLDTRRRDMSVLVDQAIANMRLGMSSKIAVPQCICKRMIKSLSASEALAGVEEAQARMIAFLKNEYLHACPKDIGLCHLPCGKDMYRHLVKELTTLDITPEEAHSYGKEEVHRISQAFKALSEKGETLLEFYDRIMSNPGEYLKDSKATIDAYRSTRSRVRRDFSRSFAYPLKKYYSIKAVSKDMESTSPAAFYMPSSYDGKFNGTFYVNARNPKGNPRYAMYSLSLHEGFHHYQFQYMVEKRIPKHMIYFIDSVAYTEGIALYAESLGRYKDDRERFGGLMLEMLRAVRLVIDTGIHWYSWSYSKALNYMMAKLPLTKDEIVTELERYICLPAQALCYSLGRRVFIDLRTEYFKARGASIADINVLKDYHELILKDGVLPLAVLQRKFRGVIENI